ncbi:substrate-binding periplasmic protein [Bdellovibrio sp. HCB290]|uniref:substrate-binding periplasmic protein n=1 Tax=Bdellovibrio sp. HCB290 TaxID=3394356 RepID=UPI0039B5BA54
MKNSLFSLLMLAASACAPALSLAAPTITFGVNSDYAMPLVKIAYANERPALDEGILKDLGEALSKEMSVQPKWFLVPKNRVAPSLSTGKVDILCHLNEVWQPKIVDDVWWSSPLYKSSNVLVFLKQRNVSSVKDIQGETVGTVLNFIYTSLDSQFKDGSLNREDGPNNVANIQKLLKGRLQYIVMSNLEYAYYKNIYSSMNSAELDMDVVMTKCAVSKKSNLKIEDVNKAVAAIHRNGKLNSILRSYYIKNAM